jgi:hypothetical protein
VRELPPPNGIDPTFTSGLPAVADEVIATGERALRSLRKNSVARWTADGAAAKTLQMAAMYR